MSIFYLTPLYNIITKKETTTHHKTSKKQNFILRSQKRYDKMKKVKRIGLLVKWLNTPPSQGGIHGSESRTDHQF